MGLYLTIFDSDGEELDGVEVGTYSNFGEFRDAVAEHLENGKAGSICPTLQLHSDCDGEWSPVESAALQSELARISARFRELPAIPLTSGWKKEVASYFSLRIVTLYDCFFDVDGEPLLERLAHLARLSEQRQLPISFQ